MLRERYVRTCSQGSEVSTDTSGVERPQQSRLGPSQESYRKAIRGNTDHITTFYAENDDVVTLRHRPTNRKKLSRMSEKLSFSLSDVPVRAGQRSNGRRFGGVGKALSKSWIGESHSNLESLLFDEKNIDHNDTVQVEKRGHLNDGMGESAGAHNSIIQNISSSQSSSGDTSDDDRSNNGRFEYYPILKPTKEEALERRKSYRNKDKGEQMRQSLPPRCERFVGILACVDNPNGNEESITVKKDAFGLNKSMIHTTGNSYQVDNGNHRHRDGRPQDQETPAECVQMTSSSPNFRRSLELNAGMLVELEQRLSTTGIYDSDSNDELNDHAVPERFVPLEYGQSGSTISVDKPSYSCKRISRPNKQVTPPSLLRNCHDYSKQRDMSAPENFSASLCTKKTVSTDDISRITDGSELLVDWGESSDLSEG